MPDTDAQPIAKPGYSRLIFGGLFLLAMIIAVWTLPLEQWLDQAAVWIEDHPWQGRLWFLVIFIIGACAMVPGSLLFLSGGYLFGFLWGVALVAVATPVAATAAFLLGATVARDQVAGIVSKYPKFSAIDQALNERGGLIVLLTRVSLILPYNVLNYAFSVTRVKLPTYFVATAVGMLPPVILFVYLGSITKDVKALIEGGQVDGNLSWALLVGSLVALIAVVVVIQRTASRVLRESLASEAR
ncbi:MAG: TVP38/TMEM64 family protein [Pseudomonadota bacterium]